MLIPRVQSLSSSPIKEFYNPKTFFTHAALLGQTVPMWPITLSGRLPIVGLVGRYLTNYLMGRELICIR